MSLAISTFKGVSASLRFSASTIQSNDLPSWANTGNISGQADLNRLNRFFIQYQFNPYKSDQQRLMDGTISITPSGEFLVFDIEAAPPVKGQPSAADQIHTIKPELQVVVNRFLQQARQILPHSVDTTRPIKIDFGFLNYLTPSNRYDADFLVPYHNDDLMFEDSAHTARPYSVINTLLLDAQNPSQLLLRELNRPETECLVTQNIGDSIVFINHDKRSGFKTEHAVKPFQSGTRQVLVLRLYQS